MPSTRLLTPPITPVKINSIFQIFFTMECPICYMPYNDTTNAPQVIVPCGHTLCKSCVKKIVESDNRCPECRAVIERVVKNFCAVPQSTKRGVTKCENCGKEYTVFCKQCQLCLCDGCLFPSLLSSPPFSPLFPFLTSLHYSRFILLISRLTF